MSWSKAFMFAPSLGFAAVLIAGSVDAQAAARDRGNSWRSPYAHPSNGAPVQNPRQSTSRGCFRSSVTGRPVCSGADELFERAKGNLL